MVSVVGPSMTSRELEVWNVTVRVSLFSWTRNGVQIFSFTEEFMGIVSENCSSPIIIFIIKYMAATCSCFCCLFVVFCCFFIFCLFVCLFVFWGWSWEN